MKYECILDDFSRMNKNLFSPKMRQVRIYLFYSAESADCEPELIADFISCDSLLIRLSSGSR